MNYRRIYDEFIADRREKEPTYYLGLTYGGRSIKDKRAIKRGQPLPYFEHHHINAKFDGGSNAADNIISLTPADHYFAHLLMAKAFGGRHYAAFWAIAGMQTGERDFGRAVTLRPIIGLWREKIAHCHRGANNRRADTTVYDWWNVRTGEHRTATRHDMPFSSNQAGDYFTTNRSTNTDKWRVRFAAKEWYVLGVSHASHEEAHKDYKERNLRNSARQIGLQSGAKNAVSKKVRCIESGIIYESQGQAAAMLGLRQPKISQCCAGQRKTHGGYHWEYVS
jgi:hypothetical protein